MNFTKTERNLFSVLFLLGGFLIESIAHASIFDLVTLNSRKEQTVFEKKLGIDIRLDEKVTKDDTFAHEQLAQWKRELKKLSAADLAIIKSRVSHLNEIVIEPSQDLEPAVVRTIQLYTGINDHYPKLTWNFLQSGKEVAEFTTTVKMKSDGVVSISSERRKATQEILTLKAKARTLHAHVSGGGISDAELLQSFNAKEMKEIKAQAFQARVFQDPKKSARELVINGEWKDKVALTKPTVKVMKEDYGVLYTLDMLSKHSMTVAQKPGHVDYSWLNTASGDANSNCKP